MLRFEEALEIALSQIKPISTIKINFIESLGYILAEDILSDMDMPPFDKSSMDGYACKISDIHNELEVLEVIAAGDIPKKEIFNNQCSKIMTGAKLPIGADCVIMVEHTENISINKIRFVKESTAINISYCAEDIKQGEIVLQKGTKIKPQHIALMASVGCIQPIVYKKPIVAVIATGSELVEPGNLPGPTQIRNSNAYQLISQIIRADFIPNYIGIAGDSEKETDLAIKKAISESDLVLITGGVSMGDFDFVPKILRENGIRLLFEKILIKPGKPTVFGIHDKCVIFGLPGNPVATYIVFEILVKPCLNKMMGNQESLLSLTLPLGDTFKRKKIDRLAWIPAIINENCEVMPVEYHGSAHIHSLNKADVIFPVNIGVSEIKKGEKVHVRQI
jgi:molybdopterin molybdotransferase